MLADHARERAGGAGGGVVGRAEDRHGGDAERRGDVHGAGIVGQKQAAGGGQIDEFAQRGLAGKVMDVDAGGPQRFRHSFAQRPLARGAE